MCGISGVVLRSGEVVNPSLLSQMGEAMARRGPDSNGIFYEKNIGLSHRRLKIIDLSSLGHQPMRSQDGKVSLVFNGEVYNFRILRTTLEKDFNRKFISQSDTEVLLQAYEVWGIEAFSKLNGMFAFALLDQREPEPVLYLVRDRFGIKPLFYAEVQGRFAFASELKPLFTLDWLPRELDSDALYFFLKASHVPNPLCIFKSVKQLEPGTYLRFQKGAFILSRYYDPREVATTPASEKKPEARWLEELEDCLKGVLSRQLISDVPVGAFLSGGIDSSLLTILSREVLGRPIDTFTVGYAESEFNESTYAEEVSRFSGGKHHLISVEAKDLQGFIREMPVYFDQPFADPTLLPGLALAKQTAKSVKVALSGDGGDELFFGYDYQRSLSYLKHFRHLPLGFRRTLLQAMNFPARSLSRRSYQQWRKLKDILEFEGDDQLLSYFIGTIGPMSFDRIGKVFENQSASRSSPLKAMVKENSDLPWVRQIEQTFLRTFLPDTVLTKTDRIGMAFGLEARVPFLDHEMVDFSARVPQYLKFKGGKSKYLLRALLKKKLPGKLFHRPKQGFSIPLQSWLKGDLRYLLDEYLNPSRLKREGLFSPSEVSKIVTEYETGQMNHSHFLFSMITFQIWKEHYRV